MPSAVDRLSSYLLQEAERFMFYPERLRRSKANMAYQRTWDSVWLRVVTDRETFHSGLDALEELDPHKVPGLLDETYCRSLLGLVPQIVQRTLGLRSLNLQSVPTGAMMTYLQEASRTYVLGLSTASVALSRSALEAAVGGRLEVHLGKAAVSDMGLEEMINRALSRDSSTRGLAHRVRTTANEVIHAGRIVSSEDARQVLEDTRTVVLKLSQR